MKKMWKPPSERSKLSSVAPTNRNISAKCEKQTGLSETKTFGNSRTNDLREISKPLDVRNGKSQKVTCSSQDNIQTVVYAKAVAKADGGVGAGVARKSSVAMNKMDVKQKISGRTTVDLGKSSVSAAVTVQKATTIVDSNDIGETKCIPSKACLSDEAPNRRLSDVNEPTRQPVSARMAAWKKKSASNEEDAMAKPVGHMTKAGLSTITERKQLVDKTVVNQNRTATVLQQSGLNNRTSHSSSTLLRNTAIGNTGYQTVPSSDSTSKHSTRKDDETSLQAMAKSKVVETVPTVKPSPKKFGLATIGIQEKLSAMCESWKKNEIAEKSRQERAAEIALLENRWKNGILVENNVVAAPSCAISQVYKVLL